MPQVPACRHAGDGLLWFTDPVTLPTVNVMLVDSPQMHLSLPGNRGAVAAHLLGKSFGHQAVSLTPEGRAALEATLEGLLEQIRTLLADHPVVNRDVEWNTLDVYVFQSAPEYTDALRSRGVAGFYNDGLEHTLVFAPHMELYVLPEHSARLDATATHEVGHFLRSRAVWEPGENFILRAFEEGLCEHLVDQTLGLKHVQHAGPLTHAELRLLHAQLHMSRWARWAMEMQPTFTEPGYRLGFHVVQELLDGGLTWSALVRLPFQEVEAVMLKGVRRFLARACGVGFPDPVATPHA